jgi:hypothetical protein
MKKHIPYLVTFPRSGSHYFDELIYKEAGIHIEKSHTLNLLFDKNNNKQRKLITIVRDPVDSITSYSAYEQSNAGPRPLFAIETRVNQLLTEYILVHNFLYDYADYVIDFNDLVSYPDAVTKKILSLLEIDSGDYVFFDTYSREYSEDYLESSKTLPNYDKNLLDKFNFDSCYFYYNKILEKKIIV